jgi:predicted nucleic acid-binding protein
MASDEPYGGHRLIVDTSAWTAIRRSKALDNTPKEWFNALVKRQLMMSPIVRLELLHSTQSRAAFQAWDDLYDFPNEVPITKRTAQTALDAIRELAAKGGGGYHRVDLGDVLIAASAQEAGVGVLHYNPKDFEKLAGVLHFRNQQLAPMGTFERPQRLAS